METDTDTNAPPAFADLTGDVPLLTAELHIVKPGTNTPTGWVITMCGPAHPKTIAHNALKQRERLHKEATIEQAQVNQKKYKAEQKTDVEANLDGVKWVVSRIESWTPVKPFKDEPEIHYSDDAAIRLLMRPEMGQYFMQIVDYINAERSFMPRSVLS